MKNSFKEIVTKKLNVSKEDYAKAEALAQEHGILLVHALVRLQAAEEKVLLAAYSLLQKIKVAILMLWIFENVINFSF